MEQSEMEYITPANAWKKLKSGRDTPQTVYIYGATGYGKTELVRHFLGRRKYLYLSCGENWTASAISREKAGGTPRKTIVIDDLHLLRDKERRQAVLELIQHGEAWLVLIGRSPIPQWLADGYIRCGFIVIKETDLWPSETEVTAYLDKMGVDCQLDTIRYVLDNAKGNIYLIRHAALCLREGAVPGPALEQEIRGAFAAYLENRVFVQWDSELLEFLMQVSVVDEFDMELAETITGSRHVSELLERAAETGNFLFCSDCVYRPRPVLLLALRRRALNVYGPERIDTLALRAAQYYELRGEFVSALKLYEACGSKGSIRELLLRNARRNPGNGQYYQLRRWYLDMDERDIEDSPVLMAAMSMLCSMLMDEEKSEYWYKKLKAFSEDARGGEKREALSRLTYLDIGLPHRGSADILEIIGRVPTLLFSKGIELPEFSVTSNLPSTMNGGKDFCQWSKRDREIAATMGPLVAQTLGRYGKGLVKAALGESLYEKGADNYEVLSLLTQAQVESESGMPEITFAAVGVRIRFYLSCGQLNAAKSVLESYENAVRKQKALQLLPNLLALKCRLALYEGDADTVTEWMAQAPDENMEFFAMERYRYLTKVRCYLLCGDLTAALALLEKLRLYGQKCRRTYLLMETGILQAVTNHRLEREREWKDDLQAVLETAERYRFLRVITEEGTAIWPLLQQVENGCHNQEWMERLRGDTEAMSKAYPLYLKNPASKFNKTALKILRLQAGGLSLNQIAQQLGMKPVTVKYHALENYKKLHVSSKAEALLAAKELGLL